MSLMSEQLLKAGLVTEEQVKNASEKPQKKHNKRPVSKQKKQVKTSSKREESDLEKFYKIRSSQDNKEKSEALKKKREAAQRKKEMNKKIGELVDANILNVKDADIRYNFVVGTTIKYVFVTEEQQESLAKGKLAITFHGGQKCIIPTDVGSSILKINPGKIVITNEVDN